MVESADTAMSKLRDANANLVTMPVLATRLPTSRRRPKSQIFTVSSVPAVASHARCRFRRGAPGMFDAGGDESSAAHVLMHERWAGKLKMGVS